MRDLGPWNNSGSTASPANPEAVDLVESGGHLAARATTSERISRIAEIVFRGLEADEASLIRRRRLLALFGEIDDDEFVLLNAYGQSYGGDGSEAWDAVDRPEAGSPRFVQGTARQRQAL